MKKRTISEKELQAHQGILFPEIVPVESVTEYLKAGKKNRARKKKPGEIDTQIESMSPNEFGEFLRNRDKLRYEKAKLIVQEEKNR